MTSFRKLYKNDDMIPIANGIYLNNKTLFDALFSDKKQAIETIVKLINSEYVNEFHGFFITVIYDEDPDQIEGFIISYKIDQIPRSSTFKAFKDTENFSLPYIHFNRMIDVFKYNLMKNVYVIKELYVFEEYRKKGHGTRLVKKSLQKAREYNSSDVIVDVEYGNEYLLNFFRKIGFKHKEISYKRFIGKVPGHYRLEYEFE
jgi:GNAT superfamily N-acetyltransferase